MMAPLHGGWRRRNRSAIARARAVCLAAALAFPGTAVAGEPAAPGAAAPAPAPAASMPATARDWYARGSALHEGGDLTGALAAFEEAYRLEPHPAYLYNLAVVSKLLGRNAEALRYFERFLEVDPGSSLRTVAEAHVAELRRALVATAPASAPAAGVKVSAVVVPPAPPPARSGGGRAGLAFGLGVGAGALVAAATALAVTFVRGSSGVDRFLERNGGVWVIDQRKAVW